MPNKNFILNLPGFTIKKVQNFNPVVLEVHYRRKGYCPHCGSRTLRKKDRFIRQVRHESIGLRQTVLRFKAYKFQCKSCLRYFAKIVADRFHVIRLLQQMCLQTYHAIDPNLRYQRGLLGMLRTHPNRLTPKQLLLRDAYFIQQPPVAAIYDFKQRFHRLLMHKHRKAKYCKRLLPIFRNYLLQLKESHFKPLVTLANTFYQWREEIVRMWRFVKNNGITEGFHRKMKLIQRRAYGFRNFENYRLRVKVLCS